MASMSPDEKKALATKAARARWSGPRYVSQATHVGEIDLVSVGIHLQCAVLDSETRVLSETGFLRAIGRSRSGNSVRSVTTDSGNATKSPPFLEAENLQPFISAELREKANPIPYRNAAGVKAWGYRAELLPQICEVFLKARDAKVLIPKQRATAEACELLVRGLAHVGIIALVDEATGYERDKESKALAKILEAFIAKELQPYVKTFPTDYYENLFRLRNLPFSRESVKRPSYFGTLTNDIIYSRLAPGVLDALKKGVPRNEDGRPTAKYFQKLTLNKGYPRLREHLGAVVMLMKVSKDYGAFLNVLDEHLPRYKDQLTLPLSYESSGDNGTGI